MRAILQRPSLGLLLMTVTLLACGAEDGGPYAPTKDTVSTEGRIRFNVSAKQIIIDEAGPTQRSDIITPCEISFVSLALDYELQSEQSLVLSASEFQLVKKLSDVTPVPGVEAGIFGVWTAEAQAFAGGVSNQIEIEIRPTTMIYRNICLR